MDSAAFCSSWRVIESSSRNAMRRSLSIIRTKISRFL